MTNQSDRQESVRASTGTALNYEGDWNALFDDAGIPVGAFNGRMLAWINDQLSSSYTELNGAMAAYAQDQGFDNWDSMGTFDAGSAPFDPATEPSLFAWVAADDPNMVTETINEAFAPAAVDTSTNTIALTTTGFTRASNYQFGTFYLSTTGTLPAPFVTGVPYIGVNDGSGNYSFYDVASDADYSRFTGYDQGETILTGYFYMLQRDQIDITTQGTGTHTISTDPLITTIKNKKDNSTFFETTTRANKFRLMTDGDGPYIFHEGATALSTTTFSEQEGNLLSDAYTPAQVGDFFENNRFLYAVCAIEPLPNPYYSKDRVFLLPSAINTGTGVFTQNNHGFVTGSEVNFDVMSDVGSLPTPTVSFAANIYVRAVTTGTYALYPTSADAIADTNRYVYSANGTGVLAVTGGTRFKSSSSSRRILFETNMQANDHTHSPACYDSYADMDLSSSSYFIGIGTSNDGNVGFTLSQSGTGDNWTVLEVYWYIPNRSVGPTAEDTGLPVTSGTYWITKNPSSPTSQRRIHRTLADAQAAVGVATATLTNTQCIKYSSLGSGRARMGLPNDFRWQAFDDGYQATTQTLAPYSTGGIWIQLIDFDDGVSGKQVYYMGVGAPDNLSAGNLGNRNSPLPAKSANSGMILNNAGQPHIPGKFKAREWMTGALNGTLSDALAVVNREAAYLASKWGYSYTP